MQWLLIILFIKISLTTWGQNNLSPIERYPLYEKSAIERFQCTYVCGECVRVRMFVVL